jgi:hypothetical protein
MIKSNAQVILIFNLLINMITSLSGLEREFLIKLIELLELRIRINYEVKITCLPSSE